MPLVYGQALSYSPLYYRARERWPDIAPLLVGPAVQPRAAKTETPDVVGGYADRINAALDGAAERLRATQLDALIVLVADCGQLFDVDNTPQLHLFAADELWADPSWPAFGEDAAPRSLRCDPALAMFLAEELTDRGFDLATSELGFQGPGYPPRRAGAALIDPLLRLACNVPIVPIHINCHVAPRISGHRLATFGAALADALTLVPQRIGLLASGGMSGQTGDVMAGWIDDVLDAWILARVRTARTSDVARIFDVESQSLRGSSDELRLWIVAGCALERSGARAYTDDYMAFHAATVGTAFVHWLS